jgi:hypothetical protein
MVHTALQNTAAMSMTCNLNTISRNSIVNELMARISTCATKSKNMKYLVVTRHKFVEAFLDHMVAI